MSSCSTCSDSACSAKKQLDGESAEQYQQRQALHSRLCQIKKKVVVLSGKGGVGKSTVAVNFALSLAHSGLKVGLLDVDVHGPSVPTLLGVAGHTVTGEGNGVDPIVAQGIKVMSVGFLLQDENEAVIWRGPAKYGVIKQLLSTVNWGELDCLVVDCPPGTGDEPLATMELLGEVSGAIVVTTPQKLAVSDVRRSVTFCHRLSVPILGVIENMSGFICPHCQENVDVFKTGGGEDITSDFGLRNLGTLPLMPEIVIAGDDGVPVVKREEDTAAKRAFERVFSPLVKELT